MVKLLLTIVGNHMEGCVNVNWSREFKTKNATIDQNYKKFYQTEIQIRKQLRYPPFCDIILIGISGKTKKEVEEVSNRLYKHGSKPSCNPRFIVAQNMSNITTMHACFVSTVHTHLCL